MPKIIEKSISILSDAGLGMAMFSLGEWSQIHSPNPYSCNNFILYPQHKLLSLLHPHHYFITIAPPLFSVRVNFQFFIPKLFSVNRDSACD